MQIWPDKLQAHLNKDGLLPVYLLTGDEPLQLQESADLIRRHARANGFTEREIFHAAQHFDWNQLLVDASSLSLFSDRKIFEVRLENKPGDQGKALEEYCQQPAADNLLIIIAPNLDKKSGLKSKWAKAVDRVGGVLQVRNITPEQLPNWIERRMKAEGIRASRQAVEILSSRVEGNLLAASQEIEKLKLLSLEGELNEETISSVVSESARYNIFSLSDKALQGDVSGACRILRGLREEGTEPLAILWLLTREIRTLRLLTEARENGQNLDSALKQLYVWDSRKSIFKRAASHFSVTKAGYLLRLAKAVDKSAKGARDASPWDELTTLIMMMSNYQPLSSETLKLSLRTL